MLYVHLVHGKIREGDVWFFVTNPKPLIGTRDV